MPLWLGLLLALLAVLPVLRFVLLRPLLTRWRRRLQQSRAVRDYNRGSAYSLPGFAPVHTELQGVPVEVEGELPEDLQGVYLRNGTNRQFAETGSRLHMFNGAGMLHQVQIADGRAIYSNTYVRTPRFQAERAAGRELYPEFGDLAGGGGYGARRLLLSALEKRAGLVPPLDNIHSASSTTAIQYHHGKLYALQETTYPFALQTRVADGVLQISGDGELDDLHGVLARPYTAHPKVDPASGAWYSFSTSLDSGEVYYSILDQGRLRHFETLHQARPAMAFVHDAFLTERFSVFPDVSLRFDPRQLFGTHQSPFYFDPDYTLRFGVVPREGGAGVRWFDTGMAGHIWHTVNGWEESRPDGGTDLVLVAPVFDHYPSNVPIHSPEEPHARLYKFILDLDGGRVSDRRCLLDHSYERPSLNTAWLGRASRYAYLLDEQGSNGIMGKGVLKYDLLDEQSVAYFDYGDSLGGEALFVPCNGAEAEDDGYLLDLLMRDDAADLVIVDARSMTELGRLRLPQRVPYGVHACWLDPAQVAALGR